MKTFTVNTQIENLKSSMKSDVARNLHYWMVGSAFALTILSVVIWNPVPLMIGLFLGIVGISEHRATPNILNALQAYDTQKPTLGEVSISITRWDTGDNYHATIREADRPDWQYEFIPQGWVPLEGIYAAKIWRLADSEPPVLAVIENGILFPRYVPKLSEKSV